MVRNDREKKRGKKEQVTLILLETSLRRKSEWAEIIMPTILAVYPQNCSDALFCCTILQIIRLFFMLVDSLV